MVMNVPPEVRQIPFSGTVGSGGFSAVALTSLDLGALNVPERARWRIVGYTCVYRHLAASTAPGASAPGVGGQVRAQRVGTSGTTGATTGNTLMFFTDTGGAIVPCSVPIPPGSTLAVEADCGHGDGASTVSGLIAVVLLVEDGR